MSRHSLPAIGLSSLLLAAQVGALELGSIRVLSADDEPFKADIELSDVGKLKPMDIAVALASEMEYEQARIDRQPFLSQLTYDVILNGRDGGVIHVSGPVAIAEDQWELLLETRWPNGRRLKQFVVDTNQQSVASSGTAFALPDQAVADAPVAEEEPAELIYEDSELPVPSEEETEPMAARPEPEISADEPAELVSDEESDAMSDDVDAPAEEQIVNTEPAAVNEQTAAPVGTDTYSLDGADQALTYTTVRGDALWRIANRFRTSNDTNIYQTLLALQQLNPDAFVKNNVNRLKVGQVLRIPTEDDVRANSRDHARQEIAEQIRIWEEEKGLVRQYDARAEANEEVDLTSESTPSLSLSTSSGSSSQNSDNTNADVEEISRRLEDALSQLETAQRNSAALSDEIQTKNETVTELRNKLAVLNEKLASLQSRLTDDETFTELKSEASAVQEESESVEAETQTEGATSEQADTELNADGTEEQLEFLEAEDPESEFEEVTAVAQPEQQSTEETASEATFKDTLMSWKGLAIIGGLLAAIGAFFFARGRKEGEYVEEDFDLPEERQVPPPAEEAAFENDQRVEEQFEEQADSEYGSSNLAESDIIGEGDVDVEVEVEVEDEEDNNDPLKEADIYLAYGRHPEAADLLENALAEDPDNIELLQKLVEVHTAAGDDEAARTALDRMVDLQSESDDFVEPTSEEELDSLDELSDFDSEIAYQADTQLPELEDISNLNTAETDDSITDSGSDLADDVLADLELDLGDDLEQNVISESVSAPAIMDLEDLQIPDELAAGNADEDDEREAIAELESNDLSDDTYREPTLDEFDGNDEMEVSAEEPLEEDANEVLDNYEVSLQSAEQLLADGRPAAARIILESMMSTGTALQKQQAKEMLMDLG